MLRKFLNVIIDAGIVIRELEKSRGGRLSMSEELINRIDEISMSIQFPSVVNMYDSFISQMG